MKQTLVDLHCHLLPGIDDGAKNLAMTMAMLRREVEDGAAGVVFTPHFYYERTGLDSFLQKRQAALRRTAAAAKAEGLPIAAKAGAEIYYTPVLPDLDLAQLAFAGTRYLLIELPTTHHPSGIEDTLFAVQAAGGIPRSLPMWSATPMSPRTRPCSTAGWRAGRWPRSMRQG